MPTIVNFTGDSDIYSSRLYTIGSHVDVYNTPPLKRARFTSPFVFDVIEFKQCNPPSIEVLPDGCLFEIFRRLPGGIERSSCASVSKRWLMLMSSIRHNELRQNKTTDSDDIEMSDLESDGYLTRSLEGKKATDLKLAAIAVGTSGRGGLGKLLIRGSNSSRGVTNLGLSAIARGCPSLKSLFLWNIPLVGDQGLFEIAKECPLLEKLDLCNCPSISNRGLVAIAQNCHNLFSLNIERCSKITNAGLQAVGKFCCNLQSVSIRDCTSIGDCGVSSLVSSASSVLSKVKLQSLNITDFSLASIGHYGKAITNLVLGGLQNVSEKGFWVMGKAQGLGRMASLTISSCRGITDASLRAIADGSPNLKRMCLRKCCFLSDDGLVAFAGAAKSLESLQLEECNRITLSGIVGAITKLRALSLVKCLGIKDEVVAIPFPFPCSSLRSLSIRNCPQFGSSSLATLGKLCSQLQNVDLSGLCGITDAGLIPLFESSKMGFVKVNLSGCFNLTDTTVSVLTMLHGGTLELLNLNGCRKITDVSLAAIAKNCLFLSDLDVSRCAVTDSGVGLLSSSDQLNLQVLCLSGCAGVSNRSLPCLKKLGRTLVGLNLQHCGSISASAVELLLEALWRGDILF